MLELWVLVLMLGRLLEIVVAVLRKLLHDLLSGFHFESFLFEDLIGSCGPLHRLLVECRVGVVNWRVPSRHGLPVELLLDWSLAGVSLGQHPVVVVVYVLSLLANHPLGRRHHRHQVLSLHDGRGRHSEPGGLPRLPGRLADRPVLDYSLLLIIFPLHGGVPVVLDCIVSPARDEFSYLGPLVPPLLVSVIDDSVLLISPGSFLYLWVEVVVPPLTTLLSNSSFQVFSNQRPSLRSVLPHEFNNFLVLLFGPRSFD